MPLYVPVVTPGVTAQNSAANVTADDVIGNKTDTTAGTSLVSIELQEQALFVNPAADSADNDYLADVVGDKADTIAGDSLMALTRRLNDGPGRVYMLPLAAAGATLTGGAGAWANPANWAQVTAASPAVDTTIVGVLIDTPSGVIAGGELDLGLGAGDPAAAAVTVPFVVVTDAGHFVPTFFPATGRVAAGTRIAGRNRTVAGGAQTVAAKVFFQAIGD